MAFNKLKTMYQNEEFVERKKEVFIPML